jgi:hypothetical protein
MYMHSRRSCGNAIRIDIGNLGEVAYIRRAVIKDLDGLCTWQFKDSRSPGGAQRLAGLPSCIP